MPWWGAVLLVILAGAVAVTGWARFRLAARLGEMEAHRGEPDQAMLLLQREVEAARNEAQKGLAETASTVRQELAQFSAQMTAQMGQVGASVQRELQHEFATGDRVDAVVRIGDRMVPVDAKFPLENFQRLLQETDETARRQARRAFVRDVKARADEIAKRYILPDEGTFDFALMYIPAENVYFEAISRDEGSEEDPPAVYAAARRVIPVSPNSLYAYLRVIVLGLRGLAIERSAQEIQERLTRLGGDLDRFRESFDVVGRHLTNARNKYDEAGAVLNRVEAKLEGIEKPGTQQALPGVGD